MKKLRKREVDACAYICRKWWRNVNEDNITTLLINKLGLRALDIVKHHAALDFIAFDLFGHFWPSFKRAVLNGASYLNSGG